MRSARSNFAAAVVLAAIGWLIYGGFVREGAGRHIDTPFWFVAAKCWTKGESPYNFHQYQNEWKDLQDSFLQPGDCPFAYPPSAAIVFWLMGLMDWRAATLYLDLLNATSLVAIGGCLWMIGKRWPAHSIGLLGIAVAAALSSSGTLQTAFTGQTTIMVTAGIGLIYAGSLYRRSLLVCLGMVLASLKPQLLIPILTWLILFGPCRKGAVIGVVLASLSLFVLLVGHGSPLADIKDSLNGYLAHPEMAPRNFFGLAPLLAALGTPAQQARSLLAGMGLATIVSLYAWLRSRDIRPSAMLDGQGNPATAQLVVSILLCASVICSPARNYDLVLLAPVFLLLMFGGRFAALAGALLAVIWKPAIAARLLAPWFGEADLQVAVRMTVTLDVFLLMLLCLAKLRAVIGQQREGSPAHGSSSLPQGELSLQQEELGLQQEELGLRQEELVPGAAGLH